MAAIRSCAPPYSGEVLRLAAAIAVIVKGAAERPVVEFVRVVVDVLAGVTEEGSDDREFAFETLQILIT
jgi:hypothetical protein